MADCQQDSSNVLSIPTQPAPIVDSDGEQEEAELVPLNEDREEVIKVTDRENERVEEHSAKPAIVNDQLDAFRQQWQEEINKGRSPRGGTPNNEANVDDGTPKVNEEPKDVENQARAYFFQGMQAEDDGLLPEAIYYYKKALQLVPDIESRLGPFVTRSPRDRVRMDSESSIEGSETEEDLITHLENLNMKEDALCAMDYVQRMTHISCLPVELVIDILRWVVSTDLDFRSLEMFSAVCRGFYICARDERIWKKGCEKIWGVNVGSTKKFGGSWRRMMIERPHLLFDGCYISKVTYVRQGEQGLDQWYRPFHLVEYFRYVRFFPDGHVLMMVSADDPVQSLPRLKMYSSKTDGILRGGYKILDKRVTLILKRDRPEPVTYGRYKRHRQQQANQNDSDLFFNVEFDVVSSGRRHNAMLQWSSYTVKTVYRSTGQESINNFDLNKRQFPALIFSRVRSYTSTSQAPLE